MALLFHAILAGMVLSADMTPRPVTAMSIRMAIGFVVDTTTTLSSGPYACCVVHPQAKGRSHYGEGHPWQLLQPSDGV